MVDIYSLCVRPPFFIIDFGLKSSEEDRRKGYDWERYTALRKNYKEETLSGYRTLYSCINGKVKSAWGMINTSRSGLPMCVTANSNAFSML